MDYEKSSKRQQWKEETLKPIFKNYVDGESIAYVAKLLAESHECPPEQIKWGFEPIPDIGDEDGDMFMWLYYTMTVHDRGDDVNREIFRIKVPIRPQIKMKSDAMRMERLHRNRMRRAHKRATGPQAPALPSAPQQGAPAADTGGQASRSGQITRLRPSGQVRSVRRPAHK